MLATSSGPSLSLRYFSWSIMINYIEADGCFWWRMGSIRLRLPLLAADTPQPDSEHPGVPEASLGKSQRQTLYTTRSLRSFRGTNYFEVCQRVGSSMVRWAYGIHMGHTWTYCWWKNSCTTFKGLHLKPRAPNLILFEDTVIKMDL